MNKKQFEERNQTITQFLFERPLYHYRDMESIVDRLHRYETTLHTINERWCNEEMSDKTTAKLEKHEKSIEDKVRKIAGELEFKVTFQGDPRGGTIRFILPSGRSNNWDGETWGIYW